MKTENFGWIYAGILPARGGKSTRLYGILVFREDGRLFEDRTGPGFELLKGFNPTQTDILKSKILQIVRGTSQGTSGILYDLPLGNIFLVNPETLERVARKSNSMYYDAVDAFKNVNRPLTVYFSPFRSSSTGKVRSKHVLVIDADGKIIYDTDDPSGWVIGWTNKPLTNARALRLVKEFLALDGIEITKKDRMFRLNPHAMKQKLKQFGIETGASRRRAQHKA